MHPYELGELARLRAAEHVRLAAAHNRHPKPQPPPRRALFLAPRKWFHDQLCGAEEGLRHRVGWALIRIGMRFVDPLRVLRRSQN